MYNMPNFVWKDLQFDVKDCCYTIEFDWHACTCPLSCSIFLFPYLHTHMNNFHDKKEKHFSAGK